MSSRWTSGEVIVHQEFWRDKLWGTRPLVVVEDTPDRLVAWCPKGTVRKVPITPSTRPKAPTRAERIASLYQRCDWVLEDREWDVSTLWLVEPTRWYAVWVSWLPNESHWGWYINFQEPMTRTDRGFASLDLMLDILVESDRSWRWKDEDEFELMVDQGLYDDEVTSSVRSASKEVIELIKSNQRPFNEPWPTWTPDPGWRLPTLPPGWDEPR